MSKRHRRGLPSLDSPSVPVNKRLNFDLHVEEDDHDLLNELSNQFDIELERLASDEELEQFDKFSPCRTRSGLVYESGNKKHKFRLSSSRGQRKLRSRTLSGQSGTGHLADCSENESETSNVDYTEDLVRPPPLNYFKPAVSRFSQIREKAPYGEIPSSPISSNMMEDHKSPVKDIVGKVNKQLVLNSMIRHRIFLVASGASEPLLRWPQSFQLPLPAIAHHEGHEAI